MSARIKKIYRLEDVQLPYLVHAIELLAHRKRGEENIKHLP